MPLEQNLIRVTLAWVMFRVCFLMESFGRYFSKPFRDKYTFDVDIGLMKLKTPLVLGSSVKTIGLPVKGVKHAGLARLSGWGMTSENSLATTPFPLQTRTWLILDREQCIDELKRGYPNASFDSIKKRVTEFGFCTDSLTHDGSRAWNVSTEKYSLSNRM